MRLDLTVVKNESVVKLEKSLKSVKNKFEDMLALVLDGARNEICPNKRAELEVVVADMLHDELGKFVVGYTKCMNKVGDLVEGGLA